MLKKFNHALSHNPVGGIWGISLGVFLGIGFSLILPGETIIPLNQFIIVVLSIGLLMNFCIATYILLTGEIKQVNVTYVCPTARKYMSEKEIEKIERN